MTEITKLYFWNKYLNEKRTFIKISSLISVLFS